MPIRTCAVLICTCAGLIAVSHASAQGPGQDRGPARKAAPKANDSANDLAARLLRFDEDKDGKLTKDELTDERLHRLFDRADTNKDGVVTKDELNALAARERTQERPGGPGFGPPGEGPPGFGPPGGGPPGFGPPGGGPGGFRMGPPRPGEVLPPMLRQNLNLTPAQEKQIDALQKEVDAKLDKILDDDQKAQLKAMRDRGPGRFGPPPGGGRPPGPGGDGPPPPPPGRPD